MKSSISASRAEEKVGVPRVAYLSGAPRVSTQPDAEAAGPRAHVLGVIGGFEAAGWKVDRFIVGDQMPRSWSSRGSERRLSGNPVRTLVADLVRLVLNLLNTRRVQA